MTSKITRSELQGMKAAGEKICSLTAYDASFARIEEQAGVELILVGDSLGMVLQGADTTLEVSMDDMVYHSRLVRRGCERAMLIVDLPYRSYETPQQALDNARRLANEGGADVVKLEGGEEVCAVVRHLCEHGLQVCAHVGLQPQSVEKYGGYKVQGRDEESAARILSDALALQDAGAMLVVLECIPSALAARISAALSIPTIGIGAGVDCDGQVLVIYDLLGISAKSPHMAKNFLADHGNIGDAVAAYVAAVKAAEFPGAEHSFS